MAINSLSASSLQGIRRGMRRLGQDAAEIASTDRFAAGGPTQDAGRALVRLHQDSQQIRASVKAFKTTDTVIGSLLDVKA